MSNSVLQSIVGITGHRRLKHPVEDVKSLVRQKLTEIRPSLVLNGMAIGFDQLVAEVCVELNIPYLAAIPFIGQDKLWPPAIKDRYRELITKAHSVKIISSGHYEAWKMHARNKYIVDNSSELLCYVEDEAAEFGGSVSCMKYAKSKEKNITNIFGS